MASSLSKTNYVDPTIGQVTITSRNPYESSRTTTTFFNNGKETVTTSTPSSSSPEQRETYTFAPGTTTGTGTLGGQEVRISQQPVTKSIIIETKQGESQPGIPQKVTTENLPQGGGFRGTIEDYSARTGSSISEKNLIPVTGTAKEFITTVRERVAPLQQPYYTIGAREPIIPFETSPSQQLISTTSPYQEPLGYSSLSRNQQLNEAMRKEHSLITPFVVGAETVGSGIKSKGIDFMNVTTNWMSKETPFPRILNESRNVKESVVDWMKYDPALTAIISKSSSAVKNQPVLVGMVDTGTGITTQLKEESISGWDKGTKFYSDYYMKVLPSSEKANAFLTMKPTGTNLFGFVGGSTGKLILGEYENLRHEPVQTAATFGISYVAGELFGIGTNMIANTLLKSETLVAGKALKTMDFTTTGMGALWGGSVAVNTVTSADPYRALAKSVFEEAVPFGMGMQSAERVFPGRATGSMISDVLSEKQRPDLLYQAEFDTQLHSGVTQGRIKETTMRGTTVEDETFPMWFTQNSVKTIKQWNVDSVPWTAEEMRITGNTNDVNIVGTQRKSSSDSVVSYKEGDKLYAIISSTKKGTIEPTTLFGKAKKQIGEWRFGKEPLGDVTSSKMYEINEKGRVTLLGKDVSYGKPSFLLGEATIGKAKIGTVVKPEHTREISSQSNMFQILPLNEKVSGGGSFDIMTLSSAKSMKKGKAETYDLVFDVGKNDLTFEQRKAKDLKTRYIFSDVAKPKKQFIQHTSTGYKQKTPAITRITNTQHAQASFIVSSAKNTPITVLPETRSKNPWKDYKWQEPPSKETLKILIKQDKRFAREKAKKESLEIERKQGYNYERLMNQMNIDILNKKSRAQKRRSEYFVLTEGTLKNEMLKNDLTKENYLNNVDFLNQEANVISMTKQKGMGITQEVVRPQLKLQNEVEKFNLPRTSMDMKVGTRSMYGVDVAQMTKQNTQQKSMSIQDMMTQQVSKQKVLTETKLALDTKVSLVQQPKVLTTSKVAQRTQQIELSKTRTQTRMSLLQKTDLLSKTMNQQVGFGDNINRTSPVPKMPKLPGIYFHNNKKLKNNKFSKESFSRKNVYVASLTAELLNIHGKRPSSAGVASGLVIRPMAR